jgi:hypothetical protein
VIIVKYFSGKELLADAKKRSRALNKAVKKDNKTMKGSLRNGFSWK